MQTRKRAKPVKFGKAAEEAAEKLEKENTETVTEEPKDPSTSFDESQDKTSGQEGAEEHPASEAITKENIGESIEEAHDDDEPEAISLSAPTSEKDLSDAEIQKDKQDIQDKEETESEPDYNASSDRSDVTSSGEKSDADHTTFNSFTMQPKKKKGSLGFFLLVIFIAFFVGLGGMMGFSYLKNANIMQKVTELTASPTPTPKLTDTPTPTEKLVDKSAYTISVLNGSGISGLAAKTKGTLTDSGFTVKSTGNADNSDYTETIISSKKDVDTTYLKELTNELEKTYKVQIAVETLSASSGTDIEVTLGSSTK